MKDYILTVFDSAVNQNFLLILLDAVDKLYVYSLLHICKGATLQVSNVCTFVSTLGQNLYEISSSY